MRNDQMIRVLGPIDVMTPAGPVGVGGRQPRALLGALVIGAGHAVSIDHLAEVLWGDGVPDSGVNTLQSYVSHLRHVLGAEVIVRTDHSYELTADPCNIDALIFEARLAGTVESKVDPVERLARCREALGMWRGRPFGDLADDEPFKLETYRLEELRVAAMEHALEAELELGHHELIVGELESAVEEYPYRERLWHLLIRALAAGDRRVEAMRACSRLRSVLGEVGVEAGVELLDLEQRILDPASFCGG